MSKSLFEVGRELEVKYGTTNNTHDMFHIGSKVRVICACQDNYFFDCETQNTKGTVIKNSGVGLGIIVEWDEPRRYEGGYVQTKFNFEPTDMIKQEVENGGVSQFGCKVVWKTQEEYDNLKESNGL